MAILDFPDKYYTFCPHNLISPRKPIPLGNTAPKLGMVGYCIGCDRHCQYVGFEAQGTKIFVKVKAEYIHRVNPHVDPTLFDNESLD